MKLCKDCKHVRRGWIFFGRYDYARCVSPDVGIDPVSGKVKESFCENQRSYDHLCGKEGKFWEAKP